MEENGKFYNKLVILVKAKTIYFDIDEYSFVTRERKDNVLKSLEAKDDDFEKVEAVKALITLSPDTFNMAFSVLDGTETELRGYSNNAVVRLVMPFSLFLEIWEHYFARTSPILNVIETIEKASAPISTFMDNPPIIKPLYKDQYKIHRKENSEDN